jgi:succinoglycan biosynthesis transport protein ExoP
MDTEQTHKSLEQVLGVIRRRGRWVVLCFILTASTAYLVSTHQTSMYTATASLVFNNNQVNQQAAGLQPVSVNNPQAQQSTNVKLVQLGDMASKTARILGQGLTNEGVKSDLNVSAQGESNIVTISATAPSPLLAAQIANTYTNLYVAEQQNTDHEYYASALHLVNNELASLTPAERTGPAGLALEGRAQSLGVLAELRGGDVQIAEAATVPKSPSSPKVARNTVIGGVLGLLLGLAVVFLLERFDRRIREPRELETIYGLPLLGVVPESSALARVARGRGAADALPPSETEAFQLIRARLRYFNVDREIRTLLVASAAAGEGKTTVAHHLASTAARIGSRVLLLEADLRQPALARQLDMRSGPGVSDVLIGAASMGDATQVIDLDASSFGASEGKQLDVLVAGSALPSNPGELIESNAMEGLLERAKAEYDLVVIDTPPLAGVSDAFPLLAKVDGVVIVGRIGQNRRDVAERLHETLAGSAAPLLGVVANGLSDSQLGSYGYAHAYHSQASPAGSSGAEA